MTPPLNRNPSDTKQTLYSLTLMALGLAVCLFVAWDWFIGSAHNRLQSTQASQPAPLTQTPGAMSMVDTIPADLSHTPFTIAFLGDQGLNPRARKVLQLIKQIGAERVVHAGDLDYAHDPEGWDQQITEILGRDFPYLVAIGNHDRRAWSGYQAKLFQRLARTPAVVCSGNLGLKSTCLYKGLAFVLSGVGTKGFSFSHVGYLRSQLAQLQTPWRFCVWHRNRRQLQVEGKKDEVPLSAYEACRLESAMIITAHAHTYSRTHLLSSFETLSVVSKSNLLPVEPGKSFVIVTGLGGKKARSQAQRGPWWASVYTATQGAVAGALFCTFDLGRAPSRAQCWFQDINGQIPDRFEIVNHRKQDQTPDSAIHLSRP